MNKNIINIKSQTKLTNFTVVFHGSTLNENKGSYGLSHLMEHLICKSFNHLLNVFDENGINWNASTSDTEVIFYMSGLEENISKYKKEFLDSILYNFNITQEELDNEKKIVLEEYLDSFNSQGESHLLNILRKKLNKFTAIGLKQDIEKINLKDVYNYYEKYFKKPSKLINIYYDNEFKIDNMGIKEFSTYYKNDNIVIGNYLNTLELNNKFNDKDSVLSLSPILKENYPESVIISLMLNYGLQSPLTNELREKRGLSYNISLTSENLNDDQFLIFQTIKTKKGNGKEVIDISKEVFNKFESNMTKERFDLIKKLLTISYKKFEIERYKHVNKYIKQEKFRLDDKLPYITFENIKKIYPKIFNVENWYFSIDHEEFN